MTNGNGQIMHLYLFRNGQLEKYTPVQGRLLYEDKTYPELEGAFNVVKTKVTYFTPDGKKDSFPLDTGIDYIISDKRIKEFDAICVNNSTGGGGKAANGKTLVENLSDYVSAGGGLVGGMRRSDQNSQQKQKQQNWQAQQNAARNEYQRAQTACLTGRGYSVQ